MKTNLVVTLSAFALMFISPVTAVYAEDKVEPDKSHEQHHPDPKSEKKDTSMNMGNSHGGMMGSMDMNQMHSNMQECMKNHKDGKMCDHSMMQKCEEKMAKGECAKMISAMKKETKETKNKK